MNRVNDLVAEFAFPPPSPHVPSSSSCLFLDILDQSNAWKGNFWCQDGFSRHVTLEEPPKLWHPSPPASQTQRSPVSRGRGSQCADHPQLAQEETIPALQWFQCGQGQPCFSFAESKPEGSRSNSRGASAFPLLPLCLGQQILLSCALGLIKKTPNVWEKMNFGSQSPKKSAPSPVSFVSCRIHHFPVSLKGFCPSLQDEFPILLLFFGF